MKGRVEKDLVRWGGRCREGRGKERVGRKRSEEDGRKTQNNGEGGREGQWEGERRIDGLLGKARR